MFNDGGAISGSSQEFINEWFTIDKDEQFLIVVLPFFQVIIFPLLTLLRVPLPPIEVEEGEEVEEEAGSKDRGSALAGAMRFGSK